MQYVPIPVKGIEVSKNDAKIIAEDFRKALPLVEDGKERVHLLCTSPNGSV